MKVLKALRIPREELQRFICTNQGGSRGSKRESPTEEMRLDEIQSTRKLAKWEFKQLRQQVAKLHQQHLKQRAKEWEKLCNIRAVITVKKILHHEETKELYQKIHSAFGQTLYQK